MGTFKCPCTELPSNFSLFWERGETIQGAFKIFNIFSVLVRPKRQMVSHDEATSGVLCSILGSSVEERQRTSREGPVEGHRDDWGPGVSPVQGRAEAHRTVQPGEDLDRHLPAFFCCCSEHCLMMNTCFNSKMLNLCNQWLNGFGNNFHQVCSSNSFYFYLWICFCWTGWSLFIFFVCINCHLK